MNTATTIDTLPSTDLTSRPLRSIGAVAAGLVTVAVLSSAADGLAHASGLYPSAGAGMAGGMFAVATTYRAAFQVLGGYLTARLAPRNPARHVAVLAGIGFALACLGVVAHVAMKATAGPLWYPLALVALALPTVWAGGEIAARRG